MISKYTTVQTLSFPNIYQIQKDGTIQNVPANLHFPGLNGAKVVMVPSFIPSMFHSYYVSTMSFLTDLKDAWQSW